MKKFLVLGGAIVLLVGLIYGKKFLIIYKSMNAFSEKNISKSFKIMYKIQPSKKILKGENVYKFHKNVSDLISEFEFKNKILKTEEFLNDTKTTGLLVLKGDEIKFEKYFMDSNEETLFSSNSICKSFVSALVGIAINEGKIQSVDDSIAKYINEFKGTDLEEVTIKDCLTMRSGINFDEEKDVKTISIKNLMGFSKMKLISKLGLSHDPNTITNYSSINTDVLGEIVSRSTKKSLSQYMEEKIWKNIGAEQDSYWTLSNKKELANGGLNISLRDYAKFGKMYLDGGKFNGKQIVPLNWVNDSIQNYDNSKKFLGYGYQFWIPKGNEKEFMAIGVFGQWIYINPKKDIVIVKTGADLEFENDDKEQKTLKFFREISNSISEGNL